MIKEIVWIQGSANILGDEGVFSIAWDETSNCYYLEYKGDECYYDFDTVEEAKTFAYKLKSKYGYNK